jgi:choline kinase
MRAIILAAGAGTRLNPLTNGCPKCLVAAGAKVLIDYQLDALHAVGVRDIVVVVGYEAGRIRDYCGARVRYVENPDFLTTNSIYSLYLARRELDADTFLFNCDIVFHPLVLERMLAAGRPNVVAVDSRLGPTAGEMNVAFDRHGRVAAISKNLESAQAQAQSMQLVKFDAAGARLVRDAVETLIAQQHRDTFPTSAYLPLIQAGTLYAVEAGDLAWGEIDSLPDYERVLAEVVPQLADR